MPSSKRLREPEDVLFRIQRGLVGHVSYLATCDVNTTFSEYSLYEPILRILMAQKFSVLCENQCPGIPERPTGDKKKIDFVVTGRRRKFAIEVKWAKARARKKGSASKATTTNKPRTMKVNNDFVKLDAYLKSVANSRAFLCVFGRRSYIESLRLVPDRFTECIKPLSPDFGRTRFSCRIYELKIED